MNRWWVHDDYTKMVLADDHDALIRQARNLAYAVMMLHENHGSTDYASYAAAKALLEKTKESS